MNKISLYILATLIVAMPFASTTAEAFNVVSVDTPVQAQPGYYGAANQVNRENVTNNGVSSSPQLALNASGQPCIAWTQVVNNRYDAFFACWNGTTWAGLNNQNGPDNVSNTRQSATQPRLAIDKYDRPSVTWLENSRQVSEGNNQLKYEVRFVQWNGSTWSGLKNANRPDIIDTYTYQPNYFGYQDLAINPKNNFPAIVWSANEDIYYRHWDGIKWTGLTDEEDKLTVKSTNNAFLDPQIAFTNAGTPHVVWEEETTTGYNKTYQIETAHWDGTWWSGYKNGSRDVVTIGIQGGGSDPSITVDAYSRPVVAFKSGGISVRHWDGANWIGLSGASVDKISGNVPNNRKPNIDSSLGGTIGVTWSALPPPYLEDEIYFARWDGSSWHGMKQPRQPDNVSRWSKHDVSPDLAMDNLGKPHIAWTALDFPMNQSPKDIYYTHWKNWK